MWRVLTSELKRHAPFTALGTLSGVGIMLVVHGWQVPRALSEGLFWGLHPMHVLLSALVTTAMYVRYCRPGFWSVLLVGYVGSVGIATLSDSIIPFIGEWMLDLPHRGVHVGFVEMWWLVNPLAVGGIVLGYFWPHTRVTHAGHVLLSTWASLFHMTMAMGDGLTSLSLLLVTVFLFLAVWVPCCTSDIAFPLVFSQIRSSNEGPDCVAALRRQKGRAA